MWNIRICIRDKLANTKKVFVIVGIVVLVLVILGGIFMFGFFSGGKTEIIISIPFIFAFLIWVSLVTFMLIDISHYPYTLKYVN